MSIPIQCPHCQRAFKLKDELAGKRVTCSGCRKPFPVPAAAVAVTAKAAPATKPPADADALAVAALSDEGPAQVTAVPDVEAARIAVKCPHCDFENIFEGRFAGKNQPCRNDECRKIIKVPALDKVDPKDWRTVKARPTLAKVETDQLEGAWGNVDKVAVSREALKEAEAMGGPIEEDDESPRWRKWLTRGLIGATVVGVLVAGTLYILRKRGEGKQERAMELALGYTDLKPDLKKKTEKLSKELSALICIAAAQHDLKAGKAKEAREHLLAAYGRLDASTFERQAALIEVAATMAELTGSPAEVEQGKRLDWDKGKVHSDIRATLQKLEAVPGDDGRDLRSFAYRVLTRKLAAHDHVDGARVLVNSGSAAERSEMLAVIGLELIALGNRDKAAELASQASAPIVDKGPSVNAPSLIALWLALGSPDAPPAKQKLAADKARAVAPPPAKDATLSPVMRIGYAEGFARQGRLSDGRGIAWAPGKPDDRLRAGSAVAAAVIDAGSGDSADLDACAKLVEGELKDRKATPWLLMRLVQISARAGKPDDAKRFASAIGDPGLRAWGQYEALKARLKIAESQKQPAESNWASEVGEPDKLAHALAWLAVARHNARIVGGDTVLREVTRMWDKEALKPFGFAGVALAGVPDER